MRGVWKKKRFLVTAHSACPYAADLMWRWLKAVGWGMIGCLVSVATAQAHVAWVTERDSVFEPGEQVTVTWRVTIPHNTLAYDLEFYLDPEAEPVPLATVGPEVMSYDWMVPDVVCDTCSLRVIQDNTDVDYDATIPIKIGVVAGGMTSGSMTTGNMTTGNMTTESGSDGATTVESTTGTIDESTSGSAAGADSSDSDASCSLVRSPGGHGGSAALWGLSSLLGVALSRKRRSRPERSQRKGAARIHIARRGRLGC